MYAIQVLFVDKHQGVFFLIPLASYTDTGLVN
ncbi:uncharacterized protein FIBRA_08347 [Fibroporia radiculosa]|uniref:Uncharacterized protein n=1 Tax=Fibroporia radiculosa TaxID=599839 RepID=J4GWM4_9APHY|nr:uncharacterized protein FIBRA_08347 [Fibroporia radiculosa]CCM06100.1 predicted protein [Fibroporia radiculosa]